MAKYSLTRSCRTASKKNGKRRIKMSRT